MSYARLIRMSVGAALSTPNTHGESCPECGRLKAANANDAANGLCPKWWAINDKEAAVDCVHFSPGGVFEGLTMQQAIAKGL